jgi:thiol-disulfide isomerase/thioredoxin
MEFQSILIAYLSLHIVLIIIGRVSPNLNFTFIFSFVLFFCFTIYYIRQFNGNNATWEILFVIITIRLLFLGGYDLYEAITELARLPFLILDLLGIISGFLYLRLENPFGLLPFLISLIFAALFIIFQGWDYLAHYYNFRTFTGKINAYRLLQKVEGFDQQNTKITNQLFKDKVVLLYFWSTGCGLCFKKFPQVQAAYDKYKDDLSVAIYTINKPFEEDKPNQVFEMIKEEGYSFPVVIPTDEELPEKFGVKGYPTTFVINQNGQIVYKGDIEGAIKQAELLKAEMSD